ncbi:MAG: hypothetical protein QOD07_2762 [Frankiaceae bacterium]|jgi:hypothetical protein|nr:hypothetical protein [Frankiaceae bacterium]
MRKTLTTLAVTATAFAVPMLGAGTAHADTVGTSVPPLVTNSCAGAFLGVDGYGACATTSSSVSVFPGAVVWTPGVPKEYVNTPAIGPVPAQAIGTPIVPSEGVTIPPITVSAPWVAICTGGC